MSIYRFGKDSLIDEVTFHRTEGGGVRAYLHASPDANPDALTALKNSLTAQTLQYAPIQEDGKPTLEVRHFGKKESGLLQVLAKAGATTGAAVRQNTPTDNISFTDKLKKSTLSLSGLLYTIGDLSFLKYCWGEAFSSKNLANGVKQKKLLDNPQALAAGLFYAAGTPFLLYFGRGDKSDLQLKHMSYNLIKSLGKDGIEVPNDSALHAVAHGHNATLEKRVHSFSERYPAEIANTMFGLAGSMIMWEKIKHLKTFNLEPVKKALKGAEWKETWNLLKSKEKIPGQTAHSMLSVIMDIGLGVMSMVAGAISVFIEEEKPQPGDEKKTGFSRLAQKIRQHPLAAAGAFLGAATTAHGVSTYVDWKDIKADLANPGVIGEARNNALKLKSDLPGRAVFVATNLGAEVLMSISSKGHGAGVRSDDSLERSAYAVAADLIQRAKPENREALLDKVADFYAHKKHLAGDREVIVQGIREQLNVMEANPWSGATPSLQYAEKHAAEDTKWRGHALASKAQPSPTLVPKVHSDPAMQERSDSSNVASILAKGGERTPRPQRGLPEIASAMGNALS